MGWDVPSRRFARHGSCPAAPGCGPSSLRRARCPSPWPSVPDGWVPHSGVPAVVEGPWWSTVWGWVPSPSVLPAGLSVAPALGVPLACPTRWCEGGTGRGGEGASLRGRTFQVGCLIRNPLVPLSLVPPYLRGHAPRVPTFQGGLPLGGAVLHWGCVPGVPTMGWSTFMWGGWFLFSVHPLSPLDTFSLLVGTPKGEVDTFMVIPSGGGGYLCCGCR